VTDVLTVSLSANDIRGHQLGPDSDAQREMVVGLDRDLDSFFSYLDKKVGLANVMIALTADHGVAPIPAEAAKLGVASARLDLEAFTAAIDATLNAKFSPGKGVEYFMPTQELPYLALDAKAFGSASEKEAEEAVITAIPDAIRKLGTPPMPPNNSATLEATRKYQESRVDADPSIYFTRSRVDLADGKVPDTEFGRRVAHSYTDHGGWYVMVVPTAYQMEYLNSNQTTHFSPWSYDRHVPLGFFGEEFVPGLYRELVAPVDIAATFASILGVNAPSASVGRILTEALRPSPAGASAH
jgi:predicted AlkP superfamily pyrophosphatase or phosphodiesterase